MRARTSRRIDLARGGSGLRAMLAFGLVLAACVVPAVASATGDSVSSRPAADANVIDGSYIVVYKSSVRTVESATDQRERALGFRAVHRYHSALQGFSAELSDDQLAALESDPDVSFIQQDRTATATGWVPRAAGEPNPPTGIRRIVAAKATEVRAAGAPQRRGDRHRHQPQPLGPERGQRQGLRRPRDPGRGRERARDPRLGHDRRQEQRRRRGRRRAEHEDLRGAGAQQRGQRVGRRRSSAGSTG